MTRSLRIVIGSLAAVALLAIGTGLALASSGQQHATNQQTAGQGDDSVENTTATSHEQEPADSGSSSRPATQGAGSSGNHGAVVSKVAQQTPPGPQHGPIVSAVARANHGATKHAAKSAAHAHAGGS